MSTLNSLGQSKLPLKFAKLQRRGLIESMNIVTDTDSKDSSGGLIDGTPTNYFENVPVQVEERKQGYIGNQAERMVSQQYYNLTFANHYNGSRINFDIKKHSFTVLARGNEPIKYYKPQRYEDTGTHFVVVCTREN